MNDTTKKPAEPLPQAPEEVPLFAQPAGEQGANQLPVETPENIEEEVQDSLQDAKGG